MPLNGHNIAHTPICVDIWTKQDKKKRLYFLTHCHADHIAGLTATWGNTIYCSPISKAILRQTLKVKIEIIFRIMLYFKCLPWQFKFKYLFHRHKNISLEFDTKNTMINIYILLCLYITL